MFFPCKLGSPASRAIDGISATQGGHQVAQMLRKTVFPSYFVNLTVEPFRSRSVQLYSAGLPGPERSIGPGRRGPANSRYTSQNARNTPAMIGQVRSGFAVGPIGG